MLLPWSKSKRLMLSIAEDGVAIRTPTQNIHMLSQTVIQNRDVSGFVELLIKNKDLLKNQTVDLILGNAFVRFVVLPWQQDVYTREDWLALANYSFRQQYGQIADTWEIRLSFGKFGETIVASAIDKAFYNELILCAKQHQFVWGCIEPLAVKMMRKPSDKTTIWTMIVEPQYLLMYEKVSGQFQRFSVMTPPLGQEFNFIDQMLTGHRLDLPKERQSNDTLIYVSGKLDKALFQQNKRHDESALICAQKQYQFHAEWLASLS